jgi:hypothetical protein
MKRALARGSWAAKDRQTENNFAREITVGERIAKDGLIPTTITAQGKRPMVALFRSAAMAHYHLRCARSLDRTLRFRNIEHPPRIMHELIRAVAIFSLCASALLVAASARQEDTTLVSATVHLLTSVTGLAAIFLMGCAIAGLTDFESTLGLALAALIGLFATLILNAMNFRAAVRLATPKSAPRTASKASAKAAQNPAPKRQPAAGANTLKTSRPVTMSAPNGPAPAPGAPRTASRVAAAPETDRRGRT